MTPADLKARRQVLGLTQKALAERLGVPEGTIWRWENGYFPIQHPTILGLALNQLWDDGPEFAHWPAELTSKR